MKKFAALIMALSLVFALTVTVNAAETEIPYDSTWKIEASDEMSSVMRAFDDDPSTYWHSKYTVVDGQITSHVECPHTITVTFPQALDVSGFRYTPRTDNGAGIALSYNIFASSDGINYKQIFEGTFDFGEGYKERVPKTASWGNVSAKVIKFEITKSVSGYGTAAEIDFFTGGSGSVIDKGAKPAGTGQTATNSQTSTQTSNVKTLKYDPSWKIEVSDEFGNSKMKAFDGDEKTYWHSMYTAEAGQVTAHIECPHTITVTFPESYDINGFTYLPRTDNPSGIVDEFNVYASTDGTSFTKISSGSFTYGKNYADKTLKTAVFDKTSMKAIKIEITKAAGGYGTAAEVEFISDDTVKADKTTANTPKPAESNDTPVKYASSGLKMLDRTGWKATVYSEKQSINRILDGDDKTYWHSDYKAEGVTILSHDNPPYNIEITLPVAADISGVTFLPRQDSVNGRPMSANLYLAENDTDDYYLLKEGFEFANTAQEKEILFTANLKVKRIKFEILVSNGGYGTMAEFYAVEADHDKQTVSYDAYAKNEAENKLYKIDSSMFSATNNSENWAENDPKNTLDGASSTFWQTEAGEGLTLDVDMRKVQGLKQINYLPRQSTDLHGCWLRVNIWTSADGENWEEAKMNVILGKTLDEKAIVFDKEMQARYVEFEIIDSVAQRASCAELTFYQSKEAHDQMIADNSEKYVLKIDSNVIDWEKAGKTGQTTIDVAPYIVNGSTLIPLRGLLEQMGAEIGWDGATQTVTINDGLYKIQLQIWDERVYVDDPKYGHIRYTLLNEPVITNNRTFIPVRFVSEQLGYTVAWDGATKTITITK